MDKMKEELTALINNVIKFFIGEKYIQDEAQRWTNDISEQIILQISEKKIKNYKFICSTTIIQYSNCSLNFSSTCLWIPTDDTSLIVRFDNDTLRCFVTLFWIKIPEDDKKEPPSKLNNNNNEKKKENLNSPHFKEKKINNEAKNNNFDKISKNNNSNNESSEKKIKRSNTGNVKNNMNRMNKMNINPMHLYNVRMNINFPQMLMNQMNMGQFRFNNLNMNMNPMFMNNINFQMGMNQMNFRPININPMLMNNIQKRNNQFNLPQMMMSQSNSFNIVNNRNNLNNNKTKASNKNINNDGNINVHFKTSDNNETLISASPFSKVKDIFINYASKSGVDKNLLGNKIFFYYKANVLDIKDERFVCEVFEDNSNIIVTKIN